MRNLARLWAVGLIALLMGGGAVAAAQDLRDTRRLIFVSDRLEPFIDVIDARRGERVHRIQVEHHVDAIAVSPRAPLLVAASHSEKALFVYDLERLTWLERIDLPMTPRHMVLDTTGARLAVTDSDEGGFALVSIFAQQVLFTLPDLAPTEDVLFSPNEIDVFYTSDATGALGLIDTNLRQAAELPLTDGGAADLSAPSRSLDGRHIYVADRTANEVFALNAYSKVVHSTFPGDGSLARPYTTPEGLFAYVMDDETGRVNVYDQHQFEEYAALDLAAGVDLVAVGRFDRMNLFLSSSNPAYALVDNVAKALVAEGELRGTPLDVQAALDGKTAYAALRDAAQIAVVELETGAIRYIPATDNGAGAMTIGLSNNVCH